MEKALQYLVRLGDAVSQLVNVAFFFSDNPNESLSGRAWRNRNKSRFWGKMMLVLDVVFWVFEREHCKKSHEADLDRAAKFLKG